MRRTLLVLSCLAALAAPMALRTPLFAETAVAPSTGQQAAPPSASDTNDAPIERRELREEREQLRAEHDQLVTERDKLKSECLDAKGQDLATCDDKKKDLHEKMEDLHARIKAFREKADAERQEHTGQSSPQPPQAVIPPTPPHP